jgi:hypothetical protein
VPVAVLPPTVELGETAREARTRVTVIDVDVTVPASEASIEIVAVALVGLLTSVKFAWSAPGRTVTLDGTGNTEGLLLLKVTVVPAAGALLFRTTAAVTGPPPITDGAMTFTPPSIGTTPKVFD